MAFNIFYHCLLAVNYLHQNKVMHRYIIYLKIEISNFRILSMTSKLCASNSLILAQLWDSLHVRPKREEAQERFVSYYADSLHGAWSHQQILQQKVRCVVSWGGSLCFAMRQCAFYGANQWLNHQKNIEGKCYFW